jgi:hypothetical protein
LRALLRSRGIDEEDRIDISARLESGFFRPQDFIAPFRAWASARLPARCSCLADLVEARRSEVLAWLLAGCSCPPDFIAAVRSGAQARHALCASVDSLNREHRENASRTRQHIQRRAAFLRKFQLYSSPWMASSFCKKLNPSNHTSTMKTTILITILTFAFIAYGLAFDVDKASTKRFKVSYVEPDKLPDLTVISKKFQGREQVLELEQGWIRSGATAEELNRIRRTQLQHYYFPILVTDTDTGNTYEVQSDRRSIVAKTKDGELIWKVSPNAGTYRVEHPFIVYFGRSTSAIADGKGDRFLGIAFNSSVFGKIDLTNGSFHHEGND